jgi:group I intron endonuclease
MNYANAGYIYAITNKVNGKQYIGSTIRPVQSRWNTHFSLLRRKKHHSYKLQSAWDAYGEENFERKLLIVCERSDILRYESKLIEQASYNIAQDPSRNGIENRWENHVKALPKPKSTVSRSELSKNMWANPTVRDKLIISLKKAQQDPVTKARNRLAKLGKAMPKDSIQKSARAKWCPLYCKELQITFLSGKFAAEYLGVLATSICNAVKNKGKVSENQYTFEKVK